MAISAKERAIREKLGVLRDFYIVDDNNEAEYRVILQKAIDERPNGDVDMILDRTARKLIDGRLGVI